MRIITFNVGLGSEGITHYWLALNGLNIRSDDILFLQEVRAAPGDKATIHHTRNLYGQRAWKQRFPNHNTHFADRGCYSILTIFPSEYEASYSQTLAIAGYLPYCLLTAITSERLILANLHLCTDDAVGRNQLDDLFSHIFRTEYSGWRAIIGGDFNTCVPPDNISLPYTNRPYTYFALNMNGASKDHIYIIPKTKPPYADAVTLRKPLDFTGFTHQHTPISINVTSLPTEGFASNTEIIGALDLSLTDDPTLAGYYDITQSATPQKSHLIARSGSKPQVPVFEVRCGGNGDLMICDFENSWSSKDPLDLAYPPTWRASVFDRNSIIGFCWLESEKYSTINAETRFTLVRL